MGSAISKRTDIDENNRDCNAPSVHSYFRVSNFSARSRNIPSTISSSSFILRSLSAISRLPSPSSSFRTLMISICVLNSSSFPTTHLVSSSRRFRVSSSSRSNFCAYTAFSRISLATICSFVMGKLNPSPPAARSERISSSAIETRSLSATRRAKVSSSL
ncbi:unnamed protein product [Haemonchus placei]|uniref:Uncharacterized protein n=1 Tax=Haemonchus placei TaxID=6290 RepID=A0A0N4WMF3_HAEPC|nr:unnamed protein product [Haemonchus placei]